jgi:hypothetical protein
MHHVLHVHIHKIIALIRCIDIGGALLDFIKNVQNGISRPMLNLIQYAHIKREPTLYVWIKNAHKILFESFNQGLSSITKKGEIESASRPLVDFGVLNDNLIK